MRKILFAVFLLETWFAFPFRKMSERHFFEQTQRGSGGKSEYVEVNQNDLNNKDYYVYYYDEKLRYCLFCYLNHQKVPMLFHFFKQLEFDHQWWEKFSIEDAIGNDLYYLYIRPSQSISIDIVLENHDASWWKREYGCTEYFTRYNDNYKNIYIINNKFDVNIERYFSSEKIDFQSALQNYMKAQKKKRDNELVEHVPKLAYSVQNSILTKDNEVDTSSVSKIAHVSKITYTEDEIKLLENSKIVAVWTLIPKKYNNKDYIEHWNKNHPENPKQVESKITYPIIMGYAYDLRDNTTYNWITDLGQDVSVLLNYADECKSTKK